MLNKVLLLFMNSMSRWQGYGITFNLWNPDLSPRLLLLLFIDGTKLVKFSMALRSDFEHVHGPLHRSPLPIVDAALSKLCL